MESLLLRATKEYSPLVFFGLVLFLVLLAFSVAELVRYKDTQREDKTALAEGAPLSVEERSPYMSMDRLANLFLKALLVALLVTSVYMLIPAEYLGEVNRQAREGLILKHMIRDS